MQLGDGDDAAAMREELGDLLLNVAFQIVIAEEEERFGLEDVAGSLIAKMVPALKTPR